MASKNVTEGFDFTENAILGFSALGTAEPYTNPVTGVKGAPKFNAQFWMLPSSQLLADLKKVIMSVARQQWGANLETFRPDEGFDAATKWKLLQLPIKSGEAINKERAAKNPPKPHVEWLDGKVRFQASTGANMRPALALAINGKPTTLRTAAEQEPFLASHFYNGVECRGMVTLSTWQSELGAGVCAYLNGIYSFGVGERVGGNNADPAATFGGHEGHVTNVDPIGNDADMLAA